MLHTTLLLLQGKISEPPKIIISRSHAGKVEETVKKAFGSDTEIIHAAGAGMLF